MAKTLVVYYSLEGNVDFISKKIAEELGADICKLETVKTYPKSGLLKFFHGGKDVITGVKPELKGPLPSLAEYDTLVIGCPVWAARPASPLNTFFDSTDLNGKKCFAFASSAGGNAVKCLNMMNEEITNKGGIACATASFTNPLKKPEAALETVKEFTAKIKA
ncbi:flavodoxin [Treponema sp.]|uniref:flavodoxin family protein n=1 Tax=Treponema sp. TaxID=166 RepID=UPI0025F35103|nr:flavodoxin [Treponema sp.]MCR5217299.1 flavodoxin [Treponema sp.]